MNRLIESLLGAEFQGKSKVNPAYQATSDDGGKTYKDAKGNDVTGDAKANGVSNLYRQPTFGEKAFAPEQANQTQALRDQFATDPVLQTRAADIAGQVAAGKLSSEIANGIYKDPNTIKSLSNPDGSLNMDKLKAFANASNLDTTAGGLNRTSEQLGEANSGVPERTAQVASNVASRDVSSAGADVLRQPTINQTLNTQANTGLGIATAQNQALPYTTKDIGQTAQLGAAQSGGALARSDIDQTTATLQSEMNRLVATGALKRSDADEAIKDYQARVLQPAQAESAYFSSTHPQAPFGSVNREIINPSAGTVSVQDNPLVSNTAKYDSAISGVKLNQINQTGMVPSQGLKLADGTPVPPGTGMGIKAGSIPTVFPQAQQQSGLIQPSAQPATAPTSNVIPPAAYQPQQTPNWLAPNQGNMSQAQALQLQQQRLMQLMSQGGQGVPPMVAQQPQMIPPAAMGANVF